MDLYSGKYQYQKETDPVYGEIYIFLLKEKIADVQKINPTPQT